MDILTIDFEPPKRHPGQKAWSQGILYMEVPLYIIHCNNSRTPGGVTHTLCTVTEIHACTCISIILNNKVINTTKFNSTGCRQVSTLNKLYKFFFNVYSCYMSLYIISAIIIEQSINCSFLYIISFLFQLL